MSHPVYSPRKLIEVALPLDAINDASVRENYIYKGNPSSLHKWWAQRPLAAARAVIFAQLVNDPGYNQGTGFKYGKNKKEATEERKRLFKILEDLVLWENTKNENILESARREIRRSWREVCELNQNHPQASELFNPDIMPELYDPFAGGATIPLEAQRLGLGVYASDINPVAVMINKALLDIPQKFKGLAPIGPCQNPDLPISMNWPGLAGLAEDIRRYGYLLRNEVEKKIGNLYPPAEITIDTIENRPDLKPFINQKIPIIAWFWARTVKSPNPKFSHVNVPLISTFKLSTKEGKEVYVQPTVKEDRYDFTIKLGKFPNGLRDGTKNKGRDASFRCIVSDVPISGDYIKSEAQAGRLGLKLFAVAAEANNRRIYLPPTLEMDETAIRTQPNWKPDIDFFKQALGFRVGNYGMSKWCELFSDRQLIALTTLSDTLLEVKKIIRSDAIKAGFVNDNVGLADGGIGATAYAEAIVVYLAFAISKYAMYGNLLVPWYTKEDRPSMLFTQQTIPMVWDSIELNPFSDIGGSFKKSFLIVANALEGIPINSNPGSVFQQSATDDERHPATIISTDPPYYDNVGYADLSDFFYIWLRHSLKDIYPDLFSTIVTPKSQELVATPERHGGKIQAEKFFLTGMTQAMQKIANQSHQAFPVTIFYAFKQLDSKRDGDTTNTGWEIFLDSIIKAGFAINGTWPMRTERVGRMRDNDSNALASSIVLVCRKRQANALTISRREFMRELNTMLPEALDEMTKGTGDDRSPVAPVDLSQAIIGPGMAIFSKYSAVLEADGSPMSVRTALQLINRFLAEDDFDADTQFCLHWFDQYGWKDGVFGEADVLARAKATSVDGVVTAGVVKSGGGLVRLLKCSEYPADWDPGTDKRMPVWEVLHHFIRILKYEGERNAGTLLNAVRGSAEAVRQLAYRLYTLCERKGWAEDGRAYNEFITSWAGIESAAGDSPAAVQMSLFNE